MNFDEKHKMDSAEFEYENHVLAKPNGIFRVSTISKDSK